MKTIEVRLLVTDGAADHVPELLDRLAATTGVVNAVQLDLCKCGEYDAADPIGEVALPTAGDWDGMPTEEKK